jgi:hypothetical protein
VSISSQQTEVLAPLARRLIESLRVVEVEAEQQLGSAKENRSFSGSLAVPSNLMVGSPSAERRLEQIRQQLREDLNRLRQEPFVASVLVEDAEGARKRYYFARATLKRGDLPGLDGLLANSRAPLGRLAELSPGESIDASDLSLPQKGELTVVERTTLRPAKSADGWDGLEDNVE